MSETRVAPPLIPIPDVLCANCGAGLGWRIGVARHELEREAAKALPVLLNRLAAGRPR